MKEETRSFLDEMSPPDMTQDNFARMLYSCWQKCGGDADRLLAIEKAAKACQEINDAGEQYSHPNADGAQAFANLCSLVE